MDYESWILTYELIQNINIKIINKYKLLLLLSLGLIFNIIIITIRPIHKAKIEVGLYNYKNN